MAHLSLNRKDCLLEELNRHEQQLNAWLDFAPANANLFLQDPVAALRAANLGLSESMLQEIEQTMQAIMRKLELVDPPAALCRKTAHASSRRRKILPFPR